MKTDLIISKINIANVTTLLKTAFVGVVIEEVWFFSMELAWNLHQAVTDGDYPLYILWLWFWSGLTVGILTAIYPFIRGAVADGVKLLRTQSSLHALLRSRK